MIKEGKDMEISIIVIHLSMLLMLAALSMAIQRKSIFIVIALVFVGIFCNNLVVKANGGKMPVFIKNMSAQIKTDLHIAPRHQVGTAHTRYAYLADFITVDKTQSTYSPGDVSMILGPVLLAICVLIQVFCTLWIEGLAGFLCNNNLPISYPFTMMSLYAVYLGCQHIFFYA
jgi:hypothetical protein